VLLETPEGVVCPAAGHFLLTSKWVISLSKAFFQRLGERLYNQGEPPHHAKRMLVRHQGPAYYSKHCFLHLIPTPIKFLPIGCAAPANSPKVSAAPFGLAETNATLACGEKSDAFFTLASSLAHQPTPSALVSSPNMQKLSGISMRACSGTLAGEICQQLFATDSQAVYPPSPPES
jgi:hypothetical protein